MLNYEQLNYAQHSIIHVYVLSRFLIFFFSLLFLQQNTDSQDRVLRYLYL